MSDDITLADIGEAGFLDRVRQRARDGALSDDGAVLSRPGPGIIVTTDMLVEGVHFRLGWSDAADVGWKAVAVNVSDVAAMGAEPWAIFVGLSAPGSTRVSVLDGLYDGLFEACDRWDLTLAGGDTVRGGELVLSVTALGRLDGPALTRSGARPGDVLGVTGPLGRAAAGVRLLTTGETSGSDAAACVAAHRRPTARVAEGRRLQRGGAHAALDLSDGLWTDVRHIAACSSVGIEIDAGLVPVAREVAALSSRHGWDPLDLAGAGGEDFELLAACAATDAVPLGLHVLGRVVEEGLWLVRDGRREPLPSGGFDHFP